MNATAFAGLDSEFIKAVAILFNEAIEPPDDQRSDMRVPFFREVRVIGTDGSTIDGQSFSRDITPRGMGLVHTHPIVDSQVVVEVETESRVLRFKAVCIWSRPAGRGWFASGMTFTGQCDAQPEFPF